MLSNVNSMPLFRATLQSNDFPTINVLELGSGCGIVGIALACLRPHCHVTLTDVSEAGGLIQKNLTAQALAKGSAVHFEELDWSVLELPYYCREYPPHLVLVSDCTYNEDSIPLLVRTMRLLSLQSPDVKILVALKRRHANEYVFFTSMNQAGFRIIESSKILLPHTWSPGDAAAEFAEGDNVVIETTVWSRGEAQPFG